MSSECAYSFWNLYKASHGKEADKKLRDHFLDMSQKERNRLVKKWAKKAQWYVQDRIGTDGEVYTAFSPTKI